MWKDDVRNGVLEMKKRIGSGFETLEDRKLCAGVFLSGHVLHVEGSAARDVARVSYTPASEWTPNGGLAVELNGQVTEFDRSQVDSIYADMGAGNDFFRADVAVNVEVHGGDGDDRLVTGRGNDTIVGGRGIDSVVGRTGYDRFVMGGDREKDRVFWFRPRYDTMVSGDRFRLPARNWWLDHENVEAFQGTRIVVRRDHRYEEQYPGRIFFTVDIDGQKNVTGLHSLSNKIRIFHPVGTTVRYFGMEDAIARGIVEDVTVA